MTSDTTVRLDDKRSRKPRTLRYDPDAETIERLIAEFELLGLRKAGLTAELTPEGSRDWALSGKLGATVVQPCVVTLQPVTTRIDAPFERIFVENLPEAKAGEEVEMPEDDRVEPRPSVLDLAQLFAEVLALELPAFPRAEGAELPAELTESEEKPNPFAVLEQLKSTLKDR